MLQTQIESLYVLYVMSIEVCLTINDCCTYEGTYVRVYKNVQLGVNV
jgi:hypothetical protein